MVGSTSVSEQPASNATVVPRHLCIIMDGNHRWAVKRRLPGFAGHRAGANRLKEVALLCADQGIKHLTVFAFSTENWGRPSAEVSMLMNLMRHVMENDIEELNERGVRLRIIGERSKFAPDIQARMGQCEALTEANDSLSLSVAVNFGGRWDILEGVRSVAEKVVAGELALDEVTEEVFASHLSLAGLPEPDLLIRTGGDFRVSNFLLWDLAYTELYFSDMFWPDFDEDALNHALKEFSHRTRRFGKRG